MAKSGYNFGITPTDLESVSAPPVLRDCGSEVTGSIGNRYASFRRRDRWRAAR